MMLREALDFPTSGEHGSRALLIGSALLLLASGVAAGAAYAAETATRLLALGVAPLVAVLLLAVRGYYYRAVAAAATTRRPTAPAFDGVVQLFREGLGATLVAVVYAAPAALLLSAAAGATQLPETLTTDAALLGEALGAVAALFGMVALVAALYLTPAALAHAAREESFRAALHARTVMGGATTEDYAVGWILAVVLQWTLGPIAVGLSTVLIGVVLYFLTGVATRYVWGASFGAARGFATPAVPREGITPPSRRKEESTLAGGRTAPAERGAEPVDVADDRPTEFEPSTTEAASAPRSEDSK
jgi:hypothetical protein